MTFENPAGENRTGKPDSFLVLCLSVLLLYARSSGKPVLRARLQLAFSWPAEAGEDHLTGTLPDTYEFSGSLSLCAAALRALFRPEPGER